MYNDAYPCGQNRNPILLRRIPLFFVIACPLLSAACAAYKSSTGTSTSPSSSSAAVISLTVSGPTTLTAGQMAQFTAVAQYSDNSTKEVTSQATWSSPTPAFATVNSTGVVTGVSPGDLQINASFQNVTSFQKITVIRSPALLPSFIFNYDPVFPVPIENTLSRDLLWRKLISTLTLV